jgi:hypothetical protein
MVKLNERIYKLKEKQNKMFKRWKKLAINRKRRIISEKM